ncbi:MAG: hypothetical protein D8M18_06950 [Bacteroidetes bacterium]|nr:hypothetical protein [Bacteroidota bacterium]
MLLLWLPAKKPIYLLEMGIVLIHREGYIDSNGNWIIAERLPCFYITLPPKRKKKEKHMPNFTRNAP